MKKKYLLTLLTISCFFLIGKSSAQLYQLLPDSNASWIVKDVSSEYTLYHHWFLSETPNDTVINNIDYCKVFYIFNTWIYDTIYTGAFRNDTSGRTFFIYSGDTTENYCMILVWKPAIRQIILQSLQKISALMILLSTA